MTRSNQPKQPPMQWHWGHHLSAVYSNLKDEVTHDKKRKAWLCNWNSHLNWVFPQQRHGDTLHLVTPKSSNPVGDGLYTQSPDVGLGVWGSDCPGLCFSGPDGWRGVAHCGWRGTAAGIATKLLKVLVDASSHPPQSFQALIGPGISGACYEVDEPVLESYNWPEKALQGKGPKRHLDLSQVIEDQLRNQGIKKIIQTGICTFKNPLLHSYRRSGKGPNQLLILFPDPKVDPET